MSENLFCIGQKRPTQRYQDNWMRTFLDKPELGEEAKDLLQEYIDLEDYQKAVLFFVSTCGFNYDHSLFLVKEFISGRY